MIVIVRSIILIHMRIFRKLNFKIVKNIQNFVLCTIILVKTNNSKHSNMGNTNGKQRRKGKIYNLMNQKFRSYDVKLLVLAIVDHLYFCI